MRLPYSFETRRDVVDLREVLNPIVGAGHQGHGYRHHGDAFDLALAVADLEVAATHVVFVEHEHRALVELVDDVLGHDLGACRGGDHHEVVAARCGR